MNLHEEVASYYNTHENMWGEIERKFGKKVLSLKCGKCQHALSSHGFNSNRCFICKCEKWVDEDEFGRDVIEIREKKR